MLNAKNVLILVIVAILVPTDYLEVKNYHANVNKVSTITMEPQKIAKNAQIYVQNGKNQFILIILNLFSLTFFLVLMIWNVLNVNLV